MKKIVTSLVATSVAMQASLASAAIDFESTDGAVDAGLKGTTNNVTQDVENIVAVLVGFLYLLAVLYAMWGGFNILTAGGDEEKVKKGKTILIQGGLGLLVIFLASSIVRWIINIVLGGTAVA